ncbi:thiamine pyrophosphate-dependent enzyme [Candidatus Tisiphia endosymbiont of Temnostethus pusillus]|uniref:thiamine pyrophosphate-dependent enzyme n=1 Tax=Candidatus Tisiphia endosymbiont of Temnostethus pusillus TaxID=3139335 RepID=UPI0035C8ACF0
MGNENMYYKNKLISDGYIVIPKFLSQIELEVARKKAESLLKTLGVNTLPPTNFLKKKELAKFIFSNKFSNVLQELSHRYKFSIPNFTIRKDICIGWHFDDEFVTSNEEKLPEILQCNIYLQDNCISYGGGIDVCKGSHNLSKELKRSKISSNVVDGETIYTKAGDLLIFDYRVIHRSTNPSVAPRDLSRIAIQWTIGKTLRSAKEFLAYLLRRQSEKLHLSDFTNKRALEYFNGISTISEQEIRTLSKDYAKIHYEYVTNQFQIEETNNNAQYILKSLEKEGIEYFFMVPGKLINPFMSCFPKGNPYCFRIQPIVATHEAGATAMADGYYRASGKTGVVICIDGPGTVNATSFLAAAQADGSSVLLLSGQIPSNYHMVGAIQDTTQAGIDTTAMLKHVCSISYHLYNSISLPKYFHFVMKNINGFKKATANISISKDVLLQKATKKPEKILKKYYQEISFIDENAVKYLINKYLKKVENICIIVGPRTNNESFYNELKIFSEKYFIPVATTISSKSLYDETSSLSLGIFGYSGNKRAIETILSEKIDLIFLIGFDVTQWTTLAWHPNFIKNKTIIQIDKDAGNISDKIEIEYGIVSEESAFIKSLSIFGANTLITSLEARKNWIEKYVMSIPKYYLMQEEIDQSTKLHPALIIQLARKIFPKNSIAVVDAGVHRSFAAHYWKTNSRNQFFAATTFAPMGWAIPASIGISVAQKDKPIVVFTGDGCMLMTGLEIQTAAKLGLDITFIVFNNGSYGASYFNNIDNEEYLTNIGHLNWDTVAQGLGLKAFKAVNKEELTSVLHEATLVRGAKLINVICDHKQKAPAKIYVEQLNTHEYM